MRSIATNCSGNWDTRNDAWIFPCGRRIRTANCSTGIRGWSTRCATRWICARPPRWTRKLPARCWRCLSREGICKRVFLGCRRFVPRLSGRNPQGLKRGRTAGPSTTLGGGERVQQGDRILHAGMGCHGLKGRTDLVLVPADVFEKNDVPGNVDVHQARLPPVFTHLLAANLKGAPFFNAAQDAETEIDLAYDVSVNP